MKQRTDVLGLGDVKPDRHNDGHGHHDHDGHDHHHEPREGVGTSGEIERRPATGSLHPSKGATGIDMGAGGEGTDIKP